MSVPMRFDRLEMAGALGDIGTLLPIAVAMVLVNGMNPLGLFFTVGLFFIASGLFFRVTVPVQPMKVIGAYAIATSMTGSQVMASTLLMGVFLMLIALTGAIDQIKKYTPHAVIRGVQLSTGALLIAGGIRFIIGTSAFQQLHHSAEPYLAVQSLGPLPIGIVIGIAGSLVTLLLLENRKYPAGLVMVIGGMIAGFLLGARPGLTGAVGLHLPQFLPVEPPGRVDFTFALFALVLPQLPMTLGNAVLAYTDLSGNYFGEQSARVTNRNVCLSMALANFFSFCLGGMPLCHGAGGLAAHYRFGARTAGSNLIIGSIFLLLSLLLGEHIIGVFRLLPLAILGILLVFAGSQLTLTIMDLEGRKEYFVATVILGITLATSLAIGFTAGLLVAWLLRWEKLSV